MACWVCGGRVYRDSVCRGCYADWQRYLTRADVLFEMERDFEAAIAQHLPPPPGPSTLEVQDSLRATYARLGFTGRGQITEAPPLVRQWEPPSPTTRRRRTALERLLELTLKEE